MLKLFLISSLVEAWGERCITKVQQEKLEKTKEIERQKANRELECETKEHGLKT